MLHFVHPVSIWRPLCVKVKSDRTLPIVLLRVSQFHTQSTIVAFSKRYSPKATWLISAPTQLIKGTSGCHTGMLDCNSFHHWSPWIPGQRGRDYAVFCLTVRLVSYFACASLSSICCEIETFIGIKDSQRPHLAVQFCFDCWRRGARRPQIRRCTCPQVYRSDMSYCVHVYDFTGL